MNDFDTRFSLMDPSSSASSADTPRNLAAHETRVLIGRRAARDNLTPSTVHVYHDERATEIVKPTDS